jgi:hypothetical protein
MNKNSKRRQRNAAITAKQSDGFPKPVYKKKAKPFPKPNGEDSALTLADQRAIFNGGR